MAILAALPEDEAEEALSSTREEIQTKYARFDDEFLRTELETARKRGWSVNPGMYVANSWAIGVPVSGLTGNALGSISIAAIDSRMTPDRQETLAKMLIGEASRIETRLKALAKKNKNARSSDRPSTSSQEANK